MNIVSSACIKKRLFTLPKTGLPGITAHKKMAPPARLDNNYNPEPENAGESAVLILIYEARDNLYIPFIKRSDNGGIHSGQIALPGGKAEPEDADHIHTALRETREEIGVKLHRSDIAGELSPLYIPVSNYIVRPVVAYLPGKPMFVLNPGEVDEIHEVALNDFLLSQVTVKQLKIRNIPADIPFYCIGKTEIWGATAMIITELKEILTKKAASD